MFIKPYNKRVLIELIEDSKTLKENSFSIPSSLKKKEERHHDEKYLCAKVIDVSDDLLVKQTQYTQYDLQSQSIWPVQSMQPINAIYVNPLQGMNVVIETYSLEEVKVGSKVYYFIPFNSVICTYREDENVGL